MEIIYIIMLCWLIDFSKLYWHGVQPGPLWMAIHFAAAWLVLVISTDGYLSYGPWLWDSIMLLITVVLVGGHFFFIEAKRKGMWYGKLFSWLSSWPFEIVAIGSLGWHAAYVAPLVGLGNLMMWIDVVRIYTGNEKYRLRPAHWTKSYWERYM